MQELERMINFYHTAFIIFLILAIIFAVISVILFFHFNIRGIFDMRTGRGARKTIQKMEEINAQTGKLRQDVVMHTPIMLNAEDRISAPPTEPMKGGEQETELLAETQAEETALLQGAEETTLLQGSEETTVLSAAPEEQQSEQKKFSGAFKIEKEIMWIHTDEML